MVRKTKKRMISRTGFLLLSIVFVVCLFGVRSYFTERGHQPNNETPSATQSERDLSSDRRTKSGIKEISFFVPYWNLEETVPDMSAFHVDKIPQRALYFGVPVTAQGVILNESERNQLALFVSRFGQYHRSLTLRMTSTEANLALFEKPDIWEVIGRDVVKVAQSYGFDRIILDLEVSALPTDEVKRQIVAFSKAVSSPVHKADIGFDMAIYGDVLYRGRPYDLLSLDALVDRWYIMAYDFHKAKGLPGPSFPLRQGSRYPYSLETLINEWPISLEKTQVVLGMFGYTWRVDDEGRPLRVASASTTNQGEVKKGKCIREIGCSVVRDPVSTEMLIRERVEGGYWDETWYSDRDSTQDKISFLRSKGFSGISFWALGYF